MLESDYIGFVQKLIEHEKEMREEQRRALEHRLHEMNGLKSQIESERGTFMTKSEYNRLHELLCERVKSLELSRAGMVVLFALAQVAIAIWLKK
jgi:chromosome segregation and condensation protein ScpB